MDVVFTSLEALILKATQECLLTPDTAAMDAFCAVLRDSPDGPQLATKAIATRIQSHKPREAILALTALDQCMRRCDANFHAEVGKFRFLNEMIKLVSPKYYADRTAPEVQQRVLHLLHTWTMKYPKESKFKVAYDMLKNQGVVKETPSSQPPEEGSPPLPRPRSTMYTDEKNSKLLQKLLQSKDPAHLQSANRLIKSMVLEEELRTEVSCQRSLEMQRALDSARLLNEMLEHASGAGDNEKQLMHELNVACEGHYPTMMQFVLNCEDDDQARENMHLACDELSQVLEKYDKIIFPKQKLHELLLQEHKVTSNNDSLLDLAGINLGKNSQEQMVQKQGSRSKDIQVVTDIFSTENGAASSVELLKPVSLMASDTSFLECGSSSTSSPPALSGLAVLDSLGADLLQQSLPGMRLGDTFTSKSIKKIPMNSIEKTSPPTEPTGSNTLDLDFLINKSKESVGTHPPPFPPSRTFDDLMVDITMEATTNRSQTKSDNLDGFISTNSPLKLEIIDNAAKEISSPKKTIVSDIEVATEIKLEGEDMPTERETKNTEKSTKKTELKPLTDLHVTLESVKPSKVSPLRVFEDESGVTVVLHMAKNKPRPDVNVVVVSTTSKNSSPIVDYKFQAVVPKGCKVRLLPPSGTDLPACNPFLPPPAITQLMLIARPPAEPPTPVSLKFVITYNCEDDSVSEMGEAAVLPLDDL